MLDTSNESPFARRTFISTAVKAAGATALLGMPGVGRAASAIAAPNTYTVQQIIDIILKDIPGAPFKETVDTIKSGTATQQVLAVVSTMFPTISVIRETIRLQANFIIAHEPSFYNHEDDTLWVSKNNVLQQKLDLLHQHQICIWRCHDYWHRHVPDGITYGVVKAAGWLPYYQPDKAVMQIPAQTLGELVAGLKASLGIAHLRVMGDLGRRCQSVALIPGAAGGQTHVDLVENNHPDVLIVGELREWETAEYFRDSLQLGNNTALIVLGHAASEEPGMAWMLDWLRPKLPGLKLYHLPSGDPFLWL